MFDSIWLQLFLFADVLLLGVLITIGAQHAYSHFFHSDEDSDTGDDVTPTIPKSVKTKLIKDAQADFKQILADSADHLQHGLKDTSDKINLHLEELGNKTVDIETKRYREELDTLYSKADDDVKQARKDISDYSSAHQQKLQQLHEQAGEDAATAQNEISDYVVTHQDKLTELYEQTDGTIAQAQTDIENYKQTLQLQLEQLNKKAKTSMTDISDDIDGYKDQLKQDMQAQMKSAQQQLTEQIDAKLADAVSSFLVETLGHNVDLGAQEDYLVKSLEAHKDELRREVSGDSKASN